MTKKDIQKIAREVANEYQMPSLADGLYLDFATQVGLRAYQAGQEVERARLNLCKHGIKENCLACYNEHNNYKPSQL